MKLATKIMLLFMLAVTAITGLFSYLTIRQDAIFFAQQHQRHASDLVETMRPHLLSAWQDGGHEKVAQVVETLSERIRHIRIRYVQLDVQYEAPPPPGCFLDRVAFCCFTRSPGAGASTRDCHEGRDRQQR